MAVEVGVGGHCGEIFSSGRLRAAPGLTDGGEGGHAPHPRLMSPREAPSSTPSNPPSRPRRTARGGPY